MSRMNMKIVDIISEVLEELSDARLSEAARELINRSDELWEDVRKYPPPVGEKVLCCGPGGGVFVGEGLSGPEPEGGCVWVRSYNGIRKARGWMEAPKGKAWK